MNQRVISFDAAINTGTYTGAIKIKLMNGKFIEFLNLNMDTFNGLMNILNQSAVHYNISTKNIYVESQHVG